MNRTKSLAAIIAAICLAFLAIPAANALAPDGKVRQSDFITALSDTRSGGHYEFLNEGIHVWTDSNTSNDKVAEYFGVTGALPTQSKMVWIGTQPQPGVQIVFDADATTGNGNDYNILVGEPVYGTDGQGFYTDWWASTGSFVFNNVGGSPGPANLCPLTTGGSGTACHGTLAEWATKVPAARMYAGGFSLGSGIKGDGVVRSIQYGATIYTYTNLPYVAPPVTPSAPAVVPVTGAATAKVHPGRIKVVVTTDATPAGSVEGAEFKVVVKVDGKKATKFALGAGEKSKFRAHTGDGRHVVTVFGNGALLGRFVVKG